ncbi:MAG: hypothetical protein ACYC6J_06320 [Coriobacteriia bacterium]
MKPVGVVVLSHDREATVYYEWHGDSDGSALHMRIEVTHPASGGLMKQDQLAILSLVQEAIRRT